MSLLATGVHRSVLLIPYATFDNKMLNSRKEIIHIDIAGNYRKIMESPITVIFQVLLYVSIVSSCSFHKKTEAMNEKQNLAFSDSLWLNFAHSMEVGNIDFLLKNSLDTIQCADCQLNPKNEEDYYPAEMVITKHLDKLMHLSSLSNKAFSTYQDSSSIQVIYLVKAKYAEEGAYDLIFFFRKIGSAWKFTGMVVD
jgi:hypothetical protein